MDISVAFPLFLIPWEDVLHEHVFLYLSLEQLFKLRLVSKEFHHCIMDYFSHAKTFDLSVIRNRFNAKAFNIATESNGCLKRLNLTHAKDWLSDNNFIPLVKRNTMLEHVDLSFVSTLTSSSVKCLADCCAANLKSLVMKDCYWMTTEGALAIAFTATALRRIDLSGCWQVNDDVIMVLAARNPMLQDVSLAKIYGITCESVTFMAKKCRQLRNLNIQGCWRVNDQAIRTVGEYCKSLRSLYVKECRDVTEASLARLRLRHVDIDVMKPPVHYKMLRFEHGVRGLNV